MANSADDRAHNADLILTSVRCPYSTISILPSLDPSDHCAIASSGSFTLHKPSPSSRHIWTLQFDLPGRFPCYFLVSCLWNDCSLASDIPTFFWITETDNMLFHLAVQRTLFWSSSHSPGRRHSTTMEQHPFVLLDISKAIDKVRHEGLLWKKPTFRSSPSFLQWPSSSLSKGIISVRANGILSYPFSLNADLFQCSLLSPALFLSFIRDLLSTTGQSIPSFYR